MFEINTKPSVRDCNLRQICEYTNINLLTAHNSRSYPQALSTQNMHLFEISLRMNLRKTIED